MTTAIIADDEDLPRKDLRRMLAQLWPELGKRGFNPNSVSQ